MAGGRAGTLLMGWLAIAWSTAAMAAPSSTVLGPDGFPADWSEEDFEVADDDAAAEQAREGTVTRATKPTTWAVSQMPSVAVSATLGAAPNSTTIPVLGMEAGLVSATLSTVPLAQANLGEKPKVDGEDLGEDVPAGGLALGKYGLAQGGVALRTGWDASQFSDILKAWPDDAAALDPLLRQMLADVLVTPGDGAKGVEPPTWLAWRMKELLDVGQAEAAWQLGQVVTPVARSRDRSLAEAWGLVRLVAGDTAAGCAALRDDAVAGDADKAKADTLWRQAVMVCQALQRGREGLGLSLQLAEGDGVAQALNPLLKSLLDAIALNGAAPAVPAGARVGALEAALYGAYPALIRDEVWGQLPDLVLWRLVRTEALPLALRTQAAERLVVRLGELDKIGEAENALTQLYGAFTFTSDQLAKPTEGDLQEPVMRRALLWQASALGNDGAEAAWLGLDRAWRGADLVTVARQVSAPPSVKIESVDGQLRELEAALWRGERGRAESLWSNLAKRDGLTAEQLRARARLGVLALAVAGKDTGVWLDQWLASVPMGTTGEKQRVLRQLVVWQAVGVKVDAAQQQQLLVRLGDVPGAAQWPVWQEMMAGVVRDGRRGEALALAVQAAAKEPSARQAAGWVGGTLNILRELGDAQALRRLALVSILPLPGDDTPVSALTATPASALASGTLALSATVPVSASNLPLNFRGGTVFLPLPADTQERAPDWLLPPPRVATPTGPTPPVPPTAPRP